MGSGFAPLLGALVADAAPEDDGYWQAATFNVTAMETIVSMPANTATPRTPR
jgi:hypothetical protein